MSLKSIKIFVNKMFTFNPLTEAEIYDTMTLSVRDK